MQVSSVSNFHPDTMGRRWSLIRLGSHRERGLLQTNIAGVCGELTVSGPHWVCPTHGVCAVPVYTAQAPGCSAGELSKAGPELHALPRSKPLRFRFSGTPRRHKLGWACILCPSRFGATQATRCLTSTLSHVGSASYHLPSPWWLYY